MIMSLYPSLEDMAVDKMAEVRSSLAMCFSVLAVCDRTVSVCLSLQAQVANSRPAPAAVVAPKAASPTAPPAYPSLYPSLGDMGLELPPEMVAEHMQAVAQYQPQVNQTFRNFVSHGIFLSAHCYRRYFAVTAGTCCRCTASVGRSANGRTSYWLEGSWPSSI